jgi:hypothetical protein
VNITAVQERSCGGKYFLRNGRSAENEVPEIRTYTESEKLAQEKGIKMRREIGEKNEKSPKSYGSTLLGMVRATWRICLRPNFDNGTLTFVAPSRPADVLFGSRISTGKLRVERVFI